jgi:signal transduction histidine kinase
VVFTDLFLVTSCLQGRTEMHGLARRQAQLEVLNGHMEEEIRGRTADLRKLNEELSLARDVAVEASHTKSSFLANMSHELRTPLNAILGYSEMLQEDVARVAPDLGEDLGQIHKAGKHLLALINDILDISKIEAGKMTLCLEDFQVAPLLSEVESTIQPLVAMHHNTFTLECGPDLGVMKADVTKVRQVLFNLLSNACKFTEAGGCGCGCSATARRSSSRSPTAASG